jgi:hypothetical protein
MASNADRSILGHRARVAAAMRVGSHLALGLSAWKRRPRKQVAAVTVAALVVDHFVVRTLRRSGAVRPDWHYLADAVDAAAWTSLMEGGGTATLPILMADSAPGAVESGYRFGAGMEAIPHPDGGDPFPPDGPPIWRWARPLTRAALPVLVPMISHRVTSLRRRCPISAWAELLGFGSFGMGFLLARLRDRLQKEARSSWQTRALTQSQIEGHTARALLYTKNTDAHAFRKNLIPLYRAGSLEAEARLRAAQDLPLQAVSGGDGTTLHSAVMGVPLNPSEAGRIWVGDRQCEQIRQFIDEAEMVPRSGGAHLNVAAIWSHLELEYLGHRTVITHDLPCLETRLDPVPAGLLLAALWKILAIHEGVPVSTVLGCVTLDVAAFVTYYTKPDVDQRPPPVVLALSLASCVLFASAIALGHGRTIRDDGSPIFPATQVIDGCAIVLVRYWEELSSRTRWGLTAALAVAWSIAALLPIRRAPLEVLVEALNPLSVAFSAYGIGERVAYEARLLEESLQQKFSEDLRESREEAVTALLGYYEEMVSFVEHETALRRSDIPEDVAAAIDVECAALRIWLARPMHDHLHEHAVV